MNYKAGDVVVIIKHFDMGMSQHMHEKYAEKEMTIASVSDRTGYFAGQEKYFYRMKEDMGQWSWTDSMISRLATYYPEDSGLKLKKSLPLI